MHVQKMASETKNTRDLRWNFRVAPADDALIRAASELAETNLTNFVRLAALTEARRILADRRHFAVDSESWQKFSDLLDRPADVPEGLKDLYSKPSVFE
jgi:uncharacterized protein (DUF1778 family)